MTDQQEYCAAVKRWCGFGSQTLKEALSLDQTTGQQEPANGSAVVCSAPDKHKHTHVDIYLGNMQLP